jgi:hypothetical protein
MGQDSRVLGSSRISLKPKAVIASDKGMGSLEGAVARRLVLLRRGAVMTSTDVPANHLLVAAGEARLDDPPDVEPARLAPGG